MKIKIILLSFLLSLIAIPANSLNQIFPEVYKFTGNITCPTKYPIKTGETSGGVYFTSCWSELAWSFYMAGGDEWTTWLNGEYVAPVPTPSPAITVTAAPVVVYRTVTETVLEPCLVPELTTRKQIRKEIKKLRKDLQKLTKKSSKR